MDHPLSCRIPSISRVRSLVESAQLARNPVAVFRKHADVLGDVYRYYFGGIAETLVISRPSVLSHVLKTNWENYRKSEIQTRRFRHFLGDGLLTSHGEVWRHKRRHLQSGFRTEQLASATAIMHASLQQSLLDFDAEIDKGPVILSHQMMAITFAIAARSLFGADMPARDIELIGNAITKIEDFILLQITKPYLAPWYWISGKLKKHETLRRQGDAVLLSHIARHDRSENSADTFLDIVLSLTDPKTGNLLSEGDMLSECMQMLVAAHETTSNVLTWTLYLLARHPDYLERVRREFSEVLDGAPLSLRHLPALKLGSAVLDESMRLYPAFWLVDRVAVKDDMVDEVAIPAGTTVIALIVGAHHSPQLWPEPERFLPERFETMGREARQKFMFLPFGGGPRQCVASNFATLQMLLILSVLLERYDFTPTSDREFVPEPSLLLRPEGGMPMRVTRRLTH